MGTIFGVEDMRPSDLCIGDTRRIMQVGQVRRPYKDSVIDEWEFKALYDCVDNGSRVVLCEGPAWNLAGDASTYRTKLQTYLWNNIGNSDVWG